MSIIARLKHFFIDKLWPHRADFFVITFVASMFFPVRHVFLSNESFFLGQYSDFTSISLYISDLLLISLLFHRLVLDKKPFKQAKLLLFLLGYLLTNLVITSPLGSIVSIFYTFTLIKLILAYEAIKGYLSPRVVKLACGTFLCFTVLGSIIGLVQFTQQSSIGINHLGETQFISSTLNIAKIVSHETAIVRPYATFPHPNVFAAYLLAALFINFSFIYKENRLFHRMFHTGTHLLIGSLLLLTASRASFVAGSLFAVPILFLINRFTRNIGNLLIVSGVYLAIIILGLKDYLLPRNSLTDNSIVERFTGNVAGWKMFLMKPLTGFGAGNHLFHVKHYLPTNLFSWEIQPIHNFYLLTLVELGVIGLAAYIVYLGRSTWNFFKQRAKSPEALIFTTMMGSFAILMLFDHYFYTIEQGRLLLLFGLALQYFHVSRETEKLS